MSYLLKEYQEFFLKLQKLKLKTLMKGGAGLPSAFFTLRAKRSALLQRVRGRFLQLHPPRLAYRSVNNSGLWRGII